MRTLGVALAAVLLTTAAVANAQTTNCTYGSGVANCYTNGSGGLTNPYAGQAAAAQQGFNQSLQRQWEQQQQFQANIRAAAAARQAQAQSQEDRADAATAIQRNAEQQREMRSRAAGRMIADHDIRCHNTYFELR